jgi:hypothetical protein
MENQTVLNKTVNEAVNFWVKYLKPEDQGNDEFASSEPSITELRTFKNFPKVEVLDSFIKKFVTFIILKLELEESLSLEIEESKSNEFETLVLKSGIDSSLLPKSVKMTVLLGKVTITDIIGQEEIIEIS